MRQDLFDRSYPIQQQQLSVGLKVPFGLRDGRMWLPKQVPRGKACDCVCPACHTPLVAKATDSSCRRPHFAHFTQTDCRAGFETALHRMAKQLIAGHIRLKLPPWDGERSMSNPPRLVDDAGQPLLGRRVEFPSCMATLLDVRIEESQNDYTPDVIATDDHGEIMIEVRVTHAVDDLKRRRVQSEGRRMIEIDLSRLPSEVVYDEAQLAHWVIEEESNRFWLSCPTATEMWRESHRDLKVALIARNEEIVRIRQQQEEEIRMRQSAQALAAAKLVEKQVSRERFCAQERSRYQHHLDLLPELVSLERIQTLLAEYDERDGEEANTLIERVASEDVRRALHGFAGNAWIYQVHPPLWQAASYHNFVQNRASGTRFNVRDVARWVLHEFGKDEVLYALFMAQYSARDKARKAGIQKHRISHWAFTERENSQIPNFYKPINAFVDRLVRSGCLENMPEVIGEVRVR